MDDSLLQSFKQIISEQTGLYIREQDNKKLIDTISSRIKILRLSSADEYLQLLNSYKNKSEWNELIKSLTTGETYFFRDKGQFSLLKNHLIPELLEKQMKDRTIKIWSAGCSTGEEPYSIAILLNELIQSIKDWDILILGTDINADAIKKAKKGSYREWSFRGIDPDLFKRYFYKSKDEWRIDGSIKELVAFKTGNFIADIYPNQEIYDIDLIVCRNVFIYFNTGVVLSIIKKFEDALKSDGYLITGHAELPHQEIGNLKPKIFPESVVYQKKMELGVRSEELKQEFRIQKTEVRSQKLEFKIPQISTPKPEIQNLFSEAKELFKKGEYPLTIEKLEHILLSDSKHFDAHCLMGQSYANMGEYEKAESHLKEAIEADKFNAEPYYLLAQISRERGRLEEEEGMLKKVIYLNPSHIAGYIELGNIYDAAGRREKALTMRKSAFKLLKNLPNDSKVEPYMEFTAGELIEHIEKML